MLKKTFPIIGLALLIGAALVCLSLNSGNTENAGYNPTYSQRVEAAKECYSEFLHWGFPYYLEKFQAFKIPVQAVGSSYEEYWPACIESYTLYWHESGGCVDSLQQMVNDGRAPDVSQETVDSLKELRNQQCIWEVYSTMVDTNRNECIRNLAEITRPVALTAWEGDSPWSLALRILGKGSLREKVFTIDPLEGIKPSRVIHAGDNVVIFQGTTPWEASQHYPLFFEMGVKRLNFEMWYWAKHGPGQTKAKMANAKKLRIFPEIY